MGVVDIGDPIPHGFVQGVLKGFRPRGNGYHGGAQELHSVNVGGLAPHVFLAHVHHALKAEARGNGRRGDAVLPRASFGDDAPLPHVLGEQGLAQGAVDLMRPRVVQVFPLHVHLGTAQFRRKTLRVIERRRPTHVASELFLELGLKRVVAHALAVDRFKLVQGMHERFCYKAAPELTKMALRIGQVVLAPARRAGGSGGPLSLRHECSYRSLRHE